MKKIILHIFLCFNFISEAQPFFHWARQFKSSSNDQGLSIAVDSAGNTYTTGYFWTTSDFDPGPAVYTLTATNGMSAFVSKLDAAGNFVWAKKIGSRSGGSGIKTDASGNVYITGWFSSTSDFDPGPGVYTVTPVNIYSDGFILKLDAAGNFIWVSSINGPSIENLAGIALDASGNIYTTGYYDGTTDFDPGPGTYTLTPTAPSCSFICKHDNNGNLVWAKSFSGGYGQMGTAIAIDLNCNVYTTGYFAGNTDFDPGAGTYNLYMQQFDIYVSKLDVNGNFLWAKQMGGYNADYGYAIAVDKHSNVYTGGWLRGSGDFDPGPGTYTLTAKYGVEGFISKLDSTGNFVWAKSFPGANWVNGLSVDRKGNVYATGQSYDTTDFDPGPATYNLVSNGAYDAFIVKLKSNGNFVCAANLGGKAKDVGCAITADKYQNIYTTGYFSDTADFNPGIGVYDLICSSNTNIFVSKLGFCNFNTNEDEVIYETGFTIYPNPSTGKITVTTNESGFSLIIYNYLGEKINYKFQNDEIDLSTEPKGIYFAEIITDGKSALRKIILE